MVRLPDEIKNYIYLNICDLTIPMVMRGFEVLDNFALPFYEDKYFNLIYGYDDIDAGAMEFNFIELLCRDLESIIRSHKVYTNSDPSPRLEELVRISEGLYLLQNLEDYYLVERVMTTSNTNEMKFAQLMNTYTGLDLIVVLSTLNSVDSDFFKLLGELIVIRNNELTIENNIDPKRIITTTFFKYLGDQDTIGSRLFRRGYDKPSKFQELSDIVPFSFVEFVKEEYEKGPAYAAINILSLLMLCSDTREQPLTSYKAISDDLVRDHNAISVIYYILSNMHTGFINHYKETIKEKLDEDTDQARIS